jgi:haloalkane dehalogenase
MTVQQTRHEIDILGSTMSYVTAGASGPVVLFLHGNPTSSYIWRNIIPHVAPVGRCIAPDLIGFGRSGKPDIAYRFADHVRYVDAFLDVLRIRECVIVAQDWGTALAFHRAARFPQTIIGLAFMEFIQPMPSWDAFHQRPQARELFQAFRTPGKGEKLVLEDNVFVERVLPGSILRTLSKEEMDAYRAPFPTPQSRRPILALPRELPIAGEPADVYAMSERDHAALRASTYPKLLFSGDPGALISPAFAKTFAAELRNCRHIDLGPGAHYLQEDQPDTIGQALRAWVAEIAVSIAA